MNFPYLLPRLARRFMPEKLVRILLLRNVVIKSGLETSNPGQAAQGYEEVLAEKGTAFRNKRVLVFGYGGRFDLGFHLLKLGAAHVILCDKYAPPDNEHNQRLFASEDKYFSSTREGIRPRPEWMTLLEEDIRQVANQVAPVDLVLSRSVYEHLDDVEGITQSLAALTRPDGMHVHFVDLRDHFFKYPFEMLRYSESTWRRWLNPSSNHNRYRLWNYRAAFEACFEQVEIRILEREEAAFRKLLPHLRREFISGNIDEDCATIIRLVATQPKRIHP